MRKTVALVLIALSGCSGSQTSVEQPKLVSPFQDRPNEQFTFQHEITIVKGDVHHFEEDGTRLLYHYVPATTIVDSNTYVISVSPQNGLRDFVDTSFDAKSDIKGIIMSAEAYCAETGFRRVDNGASIWVGKGKFALVEFCVPPEVSLPPSYKSGDRVPR